MLSYKYICRSPHQILADIKLSPKGGFLHPNVYTQVYTHVYTYDYTQENTSSFSTFCTQVWLFLSFSPSSLLFSQKGLPQGSEIQHGLLTHKNIRIQTKQNNSVFFVYFFLEIKKSASNCLTWRESQSSLPQEHQPKKHENCLESPEMASKLIGK